ncbi:hypothetical protein MRX96_008777 [Rhipicephalus microplus]
MEEPLPRERKFIVLESFLHVLLTNCSICGQAVGNLNFSVMGTLVVVEGGVQATGKVPGGEASRLFEGAALEPATSSWPLACSSRVAWWLQPSDALVLKSSWSAPSTTTRGPNCSQQ